jgi:hypothetical protein
VEVVPVKLWLISSLRLIQLRMSTFLNLPQFIITSLVTLLQALD